ncbi:MAG: radical SAM protein, partial [bacterium]|nr:radical SAM protein [bacterium]
MADYRIDSHKLIFHVDRVHQWLNKKQIYPVYAEISPTGLCNLRCVFCAYDYMEYAQRSLETKRVKKLLKEVSGLGVKSIMYAGEGEPLLHKDMAEIALTTKANGIDTAIASNGTLFNSDFSRDVLGALTWVRISLNAGTGQTYSLIHKAAPKMFHTVMQNLTDMVRVKKDRGLNTTIGVQCIVLPQNQGEILPLARTLKEIGIDYFTVKPFIQHPESINKKTDQGLSMEMLRQLEKDTESLNNGPFRIYYRYHSMLKLKEPRPYQYCLGLPFFTLIISNGDVYACGP